MDSHTHLLPSQGWPETDGVDLRMVVQEDGVFSARLERRDGTLFRKVKRNCFDAGACAPPHPPTPTPLAAPPPQTHTSRLPIQGDPSMQGNPEITSQKKNLKRYIHTSRTAPRSPRIQPTAFRTIHY